MIVHGYAGRKAAFVAGNKYKAKRTEVDGIKFASMKEARRYKELRLLERAGRIKDLEVQPKFELIVNDVKIGRYTGDFRYLEYVAVDLWQSIVEDVKGYASRDYPLRIKLMKAIHGIEVRET